MSDDDLEKLASEMKNLRPSDTARERGMEAAMAAFDTEFAAEKVSVSDKNLADAQGFEDAARPTSQSIGGGSVQAFGRNAMTTLNKIFNMSPRAAMMGGTCMAAFIAAFVVYQSVPGDQFIIPDAPSAATAEVDEAAPELDEIVVTAKKAESSRTVGKSVEVVPEVGILPKPSAEEKVATTPTPQAQGGITSINDLLNKVKSDGAKTEAENRDREAKFRQRRDEQARLLENSQATLSADPNIGNENRPTIRIGSSGDTEADKAVREYRAVLKQKDNFALFVAPQDIFTKAGQGNRGRLTTSDIASSRDSNVPMVEKQVTRRVVKTPASTQERAIPAITKTETRRIQLEDGTFQTVTETVVVQEASTKLVTIPATYETITETVLVPADEKFETFKANPITQVTETPVSTFSIDVDTASYSFMRSSLNRGQLPRPSSIRLEEMINYFPYDYEAPKFADEPFKANVTVTPTPWNADTKLMHIGIKGYVPPAEEKPRSNLVFLIDTSGSMNQTNKLPLLINSFKLLLNTLDEDDTVSIVTYAGRAGTVLEPTPASDKQAIKSALDRLRAGGSTAGAAGLELAYQQAQENFDDEGINRVILATDGDFNVGFSSPDEMKTFIKEKRETGIFLSVLGFGRGNYNDHLMQSLAQNGNGIAAYIDTLSEANKVLANEAGSALITIAKDVKIQVEFNPDTISEYRLIGYETRALKRQDFNNDKVDAGDIGAGHSVTAIYELTPVGSPAIANDPLRYITEKLENKGKGSEELAFVKIRHKLPKSDTSTLQTFPIGPSEERSLNRASDDMRFAAAVAAIGQKLRGDTQLSDFSFEEAIELASEAKGDDENGYRAEFIQLARLAETMQK